MGFGSKSERSSNLQQSSKTGKEKAQLSHADQRLKHQGKSNVKDGITFPYGNLLGEIGNNQIQSTSVETKASTDCHGQPLKGKLTKEDELVRYMSNLPGYLQCVDSSDNLQEKALNVGVLDWGRLEKWKSHRKHIPTITGNDVSSTSTILTSKTDTKSSAFSSVVPKVASANKSKQQSCSSLAPSQKDGIPRGAKPSTPKVRHYQDIETASKSALDQQKKSSKTYKSFGKSYSDVILEKEKKNKLDQKITSEMGNMPSNMRNHGGSPLPKETGSVCDVRVKNRAERRQETGVNKKDLDQKSTSSMDGASSKSRNYAGSLGSSKTQSAETESEKTKNKETEESKVDLTHECSPGEHKNIVLLLPRSARNSFFEEPRDGTLNEARRKSFSYDLLQKDHFRELCSEVPHSCTFPSGVEMDSGTDMMARGLKPSSDDASVFSDYTGNRRSQGKHSADNKNKSNDADVDTLKILEEEMAELATERSRTSSPNRRFSFSLSRLSRSFSFKESSAVPQLSSGYVSVRSGPVRSDSSGFLDDVNREKLNGHNRNRSSPFRRVLDPLLKSRGLNSFRSTDTVQPSKGSSNSSTPRSIKTNASFQEEKFGPSMTKALLEVAMKNGLPLFRFVVNNGTNMLATTMKSLASSDKGGPDYNYVFSSVNEIKKKSGSWISKGNKEKNCGYIYNIIGQMKISNSHFSDFTAEDSCNHYLVREFVLFGVEQRQAADQASAKFTPNTELAAVVIKIPGDKDIMKNGFSESLAMDMENPSSNSTTVILPGGVHSLPNKGIPSPLIYRWRFGGLCDCGGWDVGCKLHILSNQNSKCCKNSACLDPNRLELYPQGEAQQNMPVFSLVPHKKGIYAIEFSSSITALQAFFISVTVISCQKSSDLPEFGNLPEGKVIKEAMLNGSHGMDNKPIVILGTMPAKYAPNPPHSPVGRV